MKLLPPPLPRQFGERWMGVRRISLISEVQHRRVRHMIGISADMAVCTDYAFSGHPVLNHPQLGHEIGSAHVCTQVTNENLVCRLLLEKTKTTYTRTK